MNMVTQTPTPRWQHYFMRRGPESTTFWRDYLATDNRALLVILGLGFDPRMCQGVRTLLGVNRELVKRCMLVEYDEGKDSPSRAYEEMIRRNRETLNGLMNGVGVIQHVEVSMWSEEGRRIGSRRASEVVTGQSVEGFTDIVLDISAMPRGIYFPILAKLLHILDEDSTPKANLHILVSEHVATDERIQEEGIDEDASYMHGFASDLVLESTANVARIWIPVLGEGKDSQLERIYDFVQPDEICPVLPSPSTNPRRADNLIAQYRELLFDKLRVEPQNFIYASEWNPFEVYRQIYLTISRYNSALDTLGRCKVVVSALSSKLLSLGALMAAYEAKRRGYMMGIAQVETHGYRITNRLQYGAGELHTLCVAGECYHA